MPRVLASMLKSSEQTSWGVSAVPQLPVPYQSPDTVGFTDSGVLSYHHNDDLPLWDAQVAEEDIQDPESYFNPMRNNTVRLSVLPECALLQVLTTPVWSLHVFTRPKADSDDQRHIHQYQLHRFSAGVN